MLASWSEMLFSNTADHTTTSASAAEVTLLAGTNMQPYIPAGFFLPNTARGRSLLIVASGVMGCNSTPTYTFQFRLSTTQGSSTLSGTLIGQTAALACTGTLADKAFEAYLRVTCNIPGMGTTNCTLNCDGFIKAPGILASPFEYPISLGTPPSATWTATIDGALNQYLNFSVTPSASHASNILTCKRLWMMALN